MQHRIKMAKDFNESGVEESDEMPDIPSSIPFLPHVVSFMISFNYKLNFASSSAN